jgi:hypothetical protein
LTRAAGLIAGAVAGLVLASACARAQPLLALEIDRCAAVQPDEVRRVVTIELGHVLTEGAAGSGERTRVVVSCAGKLVALRADDPITGKSLERTIDLQEAPRAASRLLALAIVELVSASWTELESNPAPKVPPAGPRSSPESRQAALDIVRKQERTSALTRMRLLAIGDGMAFFSGPGLLGGGGLRLERDHRWHLGWNVDVMADHGSASTSLGAVSIDLLSASATLVFQQAWSRVGLRVGAGGRGGAARLQGHPTTPKTVRGDTYWAGWGGVLAHLGLDVALTRRWALALSAEGGYVVFPVGGLVGGAREVAVDGPWIGLQLGLGIFL